MNIMRMKRAVLVIVILYITAGCAKKKSKEDESKEDAGEETVGTMEGGHEERREEIAEKKEEQEEKKEEREEIKEEKKEENQEKKEEKVMARMGIMMDDIVMPGLPPNMQLRFDMMDNQDPLELQLSPSRAVRQDGVPVLVADGKGSIKELMNVSKVVSMVDSAKYASVILDQDSGSRHIKEGYYSKGNNDYFIEPATAENSTQHSRRRRQSNSDMYIITKTQSTSANISEANISEDILDATSDMEEVLARAEKPTQKASYAVQLMIFVDYAFFRRWQDVTGLADPVGRIYEYLTHIVNGVYMRYQNINDPMFEILVHFSGIYIARTPSDSPFVEQNRDKITGVYIDAYQAQDDFEAWLEENKSKFPEFDHAALVSGYDLTSKFRDDGTPSNTINGLAYIRGICGFHRSSLSTFYGAYQLIQTIAHEMAHNLDSQHDNLGINTCTASDQYIMASSPRALNAETKNNPFYFSSCSIKYMQDFTLYLSMKDYNCLRPSDIKDVNTGAGARLPGEVLSPDSQCQLAYGADSYYCAGGADSSVICRQMWCYVAARDTCVVNVEQRAADGTSCGNKAWCLRGECVYDSKAPVKSETCIYGDYKGQLNTGSDVVRYCPDVTRSAPYYCYDEYYRSQCCQSCASIRNDDQPGCEYGDKQKDCATVEARECYDPSTAERCCATCQRFKNAQNVGCEYGDRYSWCWNQPRTICYTQKDGCCATCAKHNTGIPSCEFGDRADWCSSYITDLRQCSQLKDTCCKTCYSGIKDCPYFDRVSNCRRDQCGDPNQWYDCCYTCQLEIQQSRTTTTTTTPTTTTTTTPTTTTTTTPTTTTTTTPTTTTTKTTKFSTTTTPKPTTTARSTVQTATPTPLPTSSTRTSPATTTTTVKSVPTSTTIPPTTTTMDPLCTDKADYCATQFTGDCYFYNETCCHSCKPHNTGPAGCEFGSRATWCGGYVMHGSTCYNTVYTETCCGECLNFFTGIKGCEYGDRSADCSLDMCVNPSSWSRCCHTCSNHIANHTTIPTTASTATTASSASSTTLSMASLTSRTETSISTIIEHTTHSSTSEATVPTTTSGPLCTDVPDYCDDQPASLCYYPEYKVSCCKMCEVAYSPFPGCEYGDRVGWCTDYVKSEQECKLTEVQRLCCQTCTQYLSADMVTGVATKSTSLETTTITSTASELTTKSLLTTIIMSEHTTTVQSSSTSDFTTISHTTLFETTSQSTVSSTPDTTEPSSTVGTTEELVETTAVPCVDATDWCAKIVDGTNKQWCYNERDREVCPCACATIHDPDPNKKSNAPSLYCNSSSSRWTLSIVCLLFWLML